MTNYISASVNIYLSSRRRC